MDKSEIEQYFEGLVHTAGGIPTGEIISDELLNEMGDNWQSYIKQDGNIPSLRSRKDFMMGAVMVAKIWKASLGKATITKNKKP